jgi:NTE family protein
MNKKKAKSKIAEEKSQANEKTSGQTPALVLTGGGARGAYQVGVLSALADHLPDQVNGAPPPFKIFCALSVGAVNTGKLVAGADNFKQAVKDLESLWRGLHCSSIYHCNGFEMAGRLFLFLSSVMFGWLGVRPPKGLLDNSPLEDLLKREIDFDKLSQIVRGPLVDAIAISASSWEHGRAVSFYEGSTLTRAWYRARRTGREEKITSDHIMASSALPFVFPARKLKDGWYGDGALRQNAPLSPAIHLGADKIFVIGARDRKISAKERELLDEYPSVGHLSGQLLDIIFNDNLEADVERLNRINHTVDAMLPERRAMTPLHHIDIFMIQPSEDIRALAGKHANELPWTVKTMLRAIGAFKDPWVLPSYLTFESGYINALIDLGRKDAERQMDTILRFLEA